MEEAGQQLGSWGEPTVGRDSLLLPQRPDLESQVRQLTAPWLLSRSGDDAVALAVPVTYHLIK